MTCSKCKHEFCWLCLQDNPGGSHVGAYMCGSRPLLYFFFSFVMFIMLYNKITSYYPGMHVSLSSFFYYLLLIFVEVVLLAAFPIIFINWLLHINNIKYYEARSKILCHWIFYILLLLIGLTLYGALNYYFYTISALYIIWKCILYIAASIGAMVLGGFLGSCIGSYRTKEGLPKIALLGIMPVYAMVALCIITFGRFYTLEYAISTANVEVCVLAGLCLKKWICMREAGAIKNWIKVISIVLIIGLVLFNWLFIIKYLHWYAIYKFVPMVVTLFVGGMMIIFKFEFLNKLKLGLISGAVIVSSVILILY